MCKQTDFIGNYLLNDDKCVFNSYRPFVFITPVLKMDLNLCLPVWSKSVGFLMHNTTCINLLQLKNATQRKSITLSKTN